MTTLDLGEDSTTDQQAPTTKRQGNQEPTVELQQGFDPDLSREDAEELVRVPVRFKESQPNPELAPITCWDCGKDGYQAVCYVAELDRELPITWRTVIVCTDCASRDDPLCGLDLSDLDHPAIQRGDEN